METKGPSEQSDNDARVSLVLASAHPVVLQGLKHVLDAEPDLNVVECCGTEREMLEAVSSRIPGVLVLDLDVTPNGGMAALRELAHLRLSTRVVLLASRISDSEVLEAVRIGVKGVALKEMTAPLLVQCIGHVSRGKVWIENRSFPALVDRLVQSQNRMRDFMDQLTPRELQILQLVAEGLRNKDITARLDITEGTVKVHIHNIYRKLGAKNRLQLALLARDGQFLFRQPLLASVGMLNGAQTVWDAWLLLCEAGVLV